MRKSFNPKVCILLSGSAGSGKDTAATILSDIFHGKQRSFKDNGFPYNLRRSQNTVSVILPLAYKLKAVVHDLYDVDIDLPQGERNTPVCTGERVDWTPRKLWQYFGTEVGRTIDPLTWINCWVKELQRITTVLSGNQYYLFVCPDVRFPNEKERLLRTCDELGFVVKHIHLEYEHNFVEVPAHVSEEFTEYFKYNCNYLIHTSTKAELYERLERLMSGLIGDR